MELISNRTKFILLVSLFCSFSAQTAAAQTCSCAGASLISSQSTGLVGEGKLFIALTSDFKEISSLYSGSDQIENDFVKRSTLSNLLELHYGITDRVTVTATFSHVLKTKESGLGPTTKNQELSTSGFGDSVFMLKYAVLTQSLYQRYQIALGAGVKAPTGISSLRNNGFLLNSDMQPGTGSWDGLAWTYASRNFPRIETELYMMGTLQITGEYDRFSDRDRYRFGNEIVLQPGVVGKLYNRIYYRLAGQFRSASPDRRNGTMMPNSGGTWMQIRSGLLSYISETVQFQIFGSVPFYQKVNGIQPSLSYTMGASLFFQFGGEEQKGFIDS